MIEFTHHSSDHESNHENLHAPREETFSSEVIDYDYN